MVRSSIHGVHCRLLHYKPNQAHKLCAVSVKRNFLLFVSLYFLLFFSIFLPDEILVEFQAAFPQSTPDSTGQFWPAAGDYSGFQKTGSLGSPTF